MGLIGRRSSGASAPAAGDQPPSGGEAAVAAAPSGDMPLLHHAWVALASGHAWAVRRWPHRWRRRCREGRLPCHCLPLNSPLRQRRLQSGVSTTPV